MKTRKELFEEILQAIYGQIKVTVDKNQLGDGYTICFDRRISHKCNYTSKSLDKAKTLFELTFLKINPEFWYGSIDENPNNRNFTKHDAVCNALKLLETWDIKRTNELDFISTDSRFQKIREYLYRVFTECIFVFLFETVKEPDKNDDMTADFEHAKPKMQQIIDEAYNELVLKANRNGITSYTAEADPAYTERKNGFMNLISKGYTNSEFVNTSEMEIFYKSSTLKQFVDIKEYAYKKGLDIIDLDSMNVKEYEKDKIYKFRGDCSFKLKDERITVSANMNGVLQNFKTSEKNWVNWSIIASYSDKNISRICTCYFIYDQRKMLHILQVDD